MSTIHCRVGRPFQAAPPIRSPLARLAAERFGLAASTTAAEPAEAQPMRLPAAGAVHLLVGPSGGGKSTRLRRLVGRARAEDWRVVDIAAIRLKRRPCVDLFGTRGEPERRLQFAAAILSRVGLGEAHVFLRLPSELSDGQRWRLRMALAHARVMAGGRRRPTLLVADEFCALLDRVTACVVARGLRRQMDRLARVKVPVRAVVATSHDDLEPALLPDAVERIEAF